MAETIESIYRKFLSCSHASTDSRSDQNGAMFFALNGPNFNGSQFALQALEKGARFAIVEDEKLASERCLVVENTLETLQQLAAHHRRQFQIPVIGITGSNGKTTTKELINAVLSRKYRVLCTQGNLNNHIGVPLTLLRLRPEHELAIIEMGANHIGEIGFLSSLAAPTHGLITNIGRAHLEGFGSLEGVIQAKTELYRHLQQHHGTVFVHSGNSLLMEKAAGISERITYPNPADFYHAALSGASPFVSFRAENGDLVQTQLIGEYNFDNMAAAACIGKYFGVEDSLVNDAIAAYVPSNNRSQVLRQGSNTILLDAYNANPSSMAAAIRNFAKIEAPSKVLILGDMFEMGGESAAEHAKIGQLLAENEFTIVLLCGHDMQHAAAQHPAFRHFQTKAQLQAWLQQHQVQNSFVLIKGSRGMGLETLTPYL